MIQFAPILSEHFFERVRWLFLHPAEADNDVSFVFGDAHWILKNHRGSPLPRGGRSFFGLSLHASSIRCTVVAWF
jgi:hypothetical protein